VGGGLLRFDYCPWKSRFIDTAADALSYYAHKIVGHHDVAVRGVTIKIVFNPEEIHLFSERIEGPRGDGERIQRPGKSGEERKFNRARARMLDELLGTLSEAAVIHEAKMPGGRAVYGPARADAPRLCVVIGPGSGGTWFVRTAYPVNAQEFAKAVRTGRAARWPP
jgi:hypothetical protein